MYLFIPYKQHLQTFFNAFVEQKDTDCLVGQQSQLDYHKVQFRSYGIRNLLKKFGLETQAPVRVNDFDLVMDNYPPDTTIVAFDLYHWYTLQALHWRKQHPESRLYIYSESKRWPANPLSRVVMRGFVWYLARKQQYIDGILVYTQEGRDFLAPQFRDTKIDIVPAPVSEVFLNHERKQGYISDGELRILCNARYVSYKRHADLFEAAAILLDEGYSLSITCIGKGKGGNDQGIEQVKAQARAAGVSEIVRFVDPVPQQELIDLYHNHDLLVLPSYNEAIGMVVPEAMACGLPTITSDTVGANVYVQPDTTGYIFQTGNVVDLADKLRQCFDAIQLERMGAQASEHIHTKYTAKKSVERFIEATSR